MQARILRVLGGREAPFSYRCNACTRCCHDKLIPVSPYEIARLAANLGLSTTETIARYTTDGTALSFPGGTCVFLDERGCSVHPDRPLACRLYPLGRIADADGTETIVELDGHPETAGEYGSAGTVDQYLESQDVAPVLVAVRRYYALLARVVALLNAQAGAGEDDDAELESVELIDVDAAIAPHCSARGIAVPADPWEKMEIHLGIVASWLDRMEP